jgi:hypothetical protein
MKDLSTSHYRVTPKRNSFYTHDIWSKKTDEIIGAMVYEENEVMVDLFHRGEIETIYAPNLTAAMKTRKDAK